MRSIFTAVEQLIIFWMRPHHQHNKQEVKDIVKSKPERQQIKVSDYTVVHMLDIISGDFFSPRDSKKKLWGALKYCIVSLWWFYKHIRILIPEKKTRRGLADKGTCTQILQVSLQLLFLVATWFPRIRRRSKIVKGYNSHPQLYKCTLLTVKNNLNIYF